MTRKEKKKLIIEALLDEYTNNYILERQYLKEYRQTGNMRYYYAYCSQVLGLLSLKWELNDYGFRDREIELIVKNRVKAK